MFHIIDPLLSAEEVTRLRELSKTIRFEDGRQSNPDYTLKNNLQPSPNDAGYQEAAKLVQTGLARNEYFRDYCLPRFVAPPMMTKYEPGMSYGEHVDSGILNFNPPIRIDISCTVFISDPEDYDGGELNIRMGDRDIKVKGKAGTAVLYPSTTYHQVLPVTRGERLVSITFIESNVRDAQQREILVELTEFLHENAARVGQEQQMRLEYVRTNLTRMWHGK
ncbi:Fe2+-dependent dioxygenase [Marinihelvus fidelis]|uniref:Fe2+-dependent dioxygenase n=1 Tax=Marinihelvus fidelis TaxID=2613842 RepID=A0A5N0TGJ7_9GAMM|nr:Fe2+-dependent dioxygenase [Marinihelvus fidelis]KAA9134182.1 Fe2+-dependent dioxygenase [Marinihelvus fidelis]